MTTDLQTLTTYYCVVTVRCILYIYVAAYSASSTSLEHRLVQAASGCAPSVESLAIFDVKQTECETLLGWVTVQPSE